MTTVFFSVAVTFGSLGPAGPQPVDIFLYDSRKRRDISEENLLSDSFRAALRRHNHFLFLHILAGAEVAKKTEGASVSNKKNFIVKSAGFL